MDLLLDIDNIDYKKTALNVQDFLDHKLPHILRLANESPASLKSPVISDMPVSHGNGENHNEEKLIKYIAAKEMINGVARAFQSCSKTSFQILKSKYIDGLQDWQVEQLMYCSHATYFKLRDKAYNEFADCFELQKGCRDLHMYDEKLV
ncbi:ArpU family phage packaging/lysis transcriptional regulator [Ligilactobacillus aviarius]|uniref:ArpU family phage packaging/lysis transcriptional regulator n=1 Tax=Ligilactobacillus aviarius TaxID=1606 RepID=UPI0024BBD125|nr:ArpU family phage packaging/lysis transcriptional regulator [Ligilactobacillus aviarius]